VNKLFVIDASGYLFSSYFAIRGMSNSKGESTNALFGFIRSALKLIADFQPTHMIAVFDGPDNAKARTAIYPEYKAHRSKVPEDLPPQIDLARSFCALYGIPTLNIEGVEADDVMGAIAKWATASSLATVYLCTSDKDMCQLVNENVLILNTRKDNLVIGPKEVEEIHGVSPNQIVDYLAMTGDASDNIPGLPGIGPKTAAELLKKFGSLEALFANADQVEGAKKRSAIIENKEKGLLSKRLVTIDTEVGVPQEEEFYRLKPLQYNELKAFYQEKNFNSLLKELEVLHKGENDAPLMEANEPYHLIDDDEWLLQLVETLKQAQEICFDTETTGINVQTAHLVGMSFSVNGFTGYVPVNGKLGLQKVIHALKPLFEDPQLKFFGHNVKYDLHILLNLGIQIVNLSFDTILASFILHSESRRHSLDVLTEQYFDKTMIEITDLIGKGRLAITMQEVPIEKVLPYACDDAAYTRRLKILFESELEKRSLAGIMFSIELPLLKVLAGMESKGIYLDIPCLQIQAMQIQQKIHDIQHEVYVLVGREFNLNSPKQLSEVLQQDLKIMLPKKTKEGFSTSKEVLETIADKHPAIGRMLEYRTLEKLRSTYLESLPGQVSPRTGRIHCTFNQSVAATGRLSCQDPNLQNIPLHSLEGKRIRTAFRPELNGWSYLSADYSQIELRLLAHMSEDQNLIQAFHSGEDIHQYTASLMFDMPLHEVTKEMRQQAKAVNYGIVYGQQAFGLSQELKVDMRNAQSFIETYFKRYPKVKEYIESQKAYARQHGKSVTLVGRERLIPEIHSKNIPLRNFAERLAVNSPLQGTAADLIKIAMLRIDEKLKKESLKSYMILQIHDELLFEVPDEEIFILTSLVKEAMETVFQLKVPLIVDISVGKNWGEC